MGMENGMSEIEEEAYTELCEENARLKALLKRAAEALEGPPWVVSNAILQLVEELRKAAG
jgi:predicted nucleic acid-binding Zn ribbon protein